jgi:hypothetical protein
MLRPYGVRAAGKGVDDRWGRSMAGRGDGVGMQQYQYIAFRGFDSVAFARFHAMRGSNTPQRIGNRLF